MSAPRVSINDVAKAAGVSRTTVSRAINNSGYLSDEKREAIDRVIRELGYRPNALARSLVKSKSKTIGLCIPYLNSPFISNLMDGVEAEAEKHGYDIFMCHTKEDPEVERTAVTRMIDRQVEGIIIAPVMGGNDAIRECMQVVPTVLFLRKPAGVQKNLVLASDYESTRRSFGLLLERGHRRIGILTGPSGVSTMTDRWRGIVDEMARFGLEPDPALVMTAPFKYQDNYDAAEKLLTMKNRPTAIYATHYWASSSLLSVIYDLGLSIPRDVSAVAYESFDNWNMDYTTRFATNIFPSVKMGKAAMQALHHLIATNTLFLDDNIVIDLEFFNHDSVKTLATAAAASAAQ